MNYTGAKEFANQALSNVKPPAIIYADATVAPPLLYVQQVLKEQKGKDIKIISSIGSSENSPDFNALTIEKLMSERNIYVISPREGYCPDFLLRRYRFEPWGVLWHVVEKNK